MKSLFRNGWAVLAAVTLLSGLPLNARAGDRLSRDEQCSIAVFAKTAPKLDRVCDESTVRRLAKNGQVFEQNQMGMASVLGIAPGSDAKDALAWFEKAAHQGYAPAQVNLAIMYSNGWGAASNQAAALHWLRGLAPAAIEDGVGRRDARRRGRILALHDLDEDVDGRLGVAPCQ